MNKVKYRKCPDCNSKMLLRKSHSKGTKFWGCTAWKETGCNGSAPYWGDGARAGLDLDIREIKNGYIITTSKKYADNAEDDTAIEMYVENKENLTNVLKDLFDQQTDELYQKITNSTEFVDEINEEKHKVRVKAVRQGTANVDELLKKMAQAKKKAEELEAHD